MTASTGHSYQRDILGNRTWRNPFSSTTVEHVWDDAGRMTKAAGPNNGATYSYRADGMRTKKVTGLTLAYIEDPESETSSGFYDEYQAVNHPTWRYRYDGQMCVEEDFTTVDEATLTQTGTSYALGARGIDMLQPYSVNTSNWTRTYDAPHFPLYDGHGNMVATLSRDGSGYDIANERQYDVWGGVRSGASTGDPNTRYCANLGHKQDDESGLIYMRARYYEPGTGRFVSEDPARAGWNWFVYCRNLPTTLSDEQGTQSHFDGNTPWLRALCYISMALALSYCAFAVAQFVTAKTPRGVRDATVYCMVAIACVDLALAAADTGAAEGVALFATFGGMEAMGIVAYRRVSDLMKLTSLPEALSSWVGQARGTIAGNFLKVTLLYTLVLSGYLVAALFGEM